MVRRICLLVFLALSFILSTEASYTYDRLDKYNTVLLICDIEEGLYLMARDHQPLSFRSNFLAHAALGKIFNLPAVIASVGTTGPNGPLVPEILELLPNATVIERPGEISPWDNPAFRNAVVATSKKQAVIAGIVTDVCVLSTALAMKEANYNVFVHSDASGAFNEKSASDARDHLRAAGVNVLSMLAVALELVRDWRNTPGTPEMLPFFDKYLPQYGSLARGHDWAVANGTTSGLDITLDAQYPV